MSIRLEEEITEPGFYFVRLHDQGGYPFWVWLRVYEKPIRLMDMDSPTELYCSAIDIGHQGINDTKISSIWNAEKVIEAPDLFSIIPKVE